MRLLILTPQFPYPPHQGTTIRNFNLIRHLSSRHEVHLLSFVERPGELDLGPLRAHCTSICAVTMPQRGTLARARDTLFSPLCDMALRLESEAMHRQLSEFLKWGIYDVIQVEGIEMGPYLLQVKRERELLGRLQRGTTGGGPLIVFDDHNCEYLLQQRAFETDVQEQRRWLGTVYSFIQWKKLARYEKRCCSAADRVTVVSRADGTALRELVPGLEVTVVPNGVDAKAYDPQQVEPLDLGPAAIVFTGKMDFRPNVDAVLWFAQEVMPLVQNEVPEAHFYIVGQQPHPRLNALRHHPDITITGFVPQPQPYIAAAAVYVVPMRMGGGTRLKILEAMAMGRAVVSTGLGYEGFPLMKAGDHLLVGDSANVFAQGVVALIRNPSWRQALGQAAREFVTRWYDWSLIVPRLEAVYSAPLDR
jgi:glycosyltransferase involved in cell wall biosynthesis